MLIRLNSRDASERQITPSALVYTSASSGLSPDQGAQRMNVALREAPFSFIFFIFGVARLREVWFKRMT